MYTMWHYTIRSYNFPWGQHGKMKDPRTGTRGGLIWPRPRARSDRREYQVEGSSFYHVGRMESYELFYYTEKISGKYTSLTGSIFNNIYNGNIFPSLNPAKIFQFISRWTESRKSSAVGPNHCAVINTSNEVKSPLLWEFWIYNFSLRILEGSFVGNIVNIRNECLFSGFMGNES